MLTWSIDAKVYKKGLIVLGPRYFTNDQLVRINHLVHEARHAEGSPRWPHDSCPNGEPQCDILEDGAYTVSITMLVGISKYCSNCSEELRKDADQRAWIQMYYVPNPSGLAKALAPTLTGWDARFP